jgi:hypothetical protein
MPQPPDDKFKFVRYEREGGLNCLLFVLAALVLAFLVTLALYAFEVLR